jgi:hypothetical protein
MNRRELLVTSLGAVIGGAVGGAGLVLLSACRGGGFATGPSNLNPGSETGPCPLNPEQEEGPFYIDEGLLRSEVRPAKDSTPWSAPARRRFGHPHAVSNSDS